ncbi:gpi anchored protein [Diplodia corticola]|uniref:Gpi anchored protein n=1 Tax=Diplodia corticola TaxID=236234 RepID=A0A1J9R039_9PEZI|nr:gpi anchored protein [Diplodia corticola]OJD33618.1 gpi anchored protein [Diplodia corticola]
MPSSFFSLPSSLLLLSLSNYLATAEPWPYNLPKHEKYWPEHEEFVKRDAYIHERVARQPPAGVQKMSHDPGEKFYLHYWQFEEATGSAEQVPDSFRARARTVDVDGDEHYSNTSLAENLLPPLLLHSETSEAGRSLLRFFQRNLFDKRGYECPTGTNSCTSINRPNSCCPSDESCVIVEDTGVGDVGCCPAGTTCLGGVSSCNTDAGYTSCPGSDNGGCCIPGYSCQDIGCMHQYGYCHHDPSPGHVYCQQHTKNIDFPRRPDHNKQRGDDEHKDDGDKNDDGEIVELGSFHKLQEGQQHHQQHKNKHKHKHNPAGHAYLQHRLPVLSCEPGRRVLPDRQSMRVCRMPGAVDGILHLEQC